MRWMRWSFDRHMARCLISEVQVDGAVDEINVDPIVPGFISLGFLDTVHQLVSPLVEVGQVGAG